MLESAQPHRVVIMGGGFGGTYTAIQLERRWKRDPRLEITLVSRENFYLMTPLLFEAASGVLEARHAVNPIRPLLEKTRFVEAIVDDVDFDERLVHAHDRTGEYHHEIPYDELVIALGGAPNYQLVPGSEQAMSFKTIADAMLLRNHVLNAFERAVIEDDPARRRELLTFIVVGGGLVGVELTGELSHFVHSLLRIYKTIDRREMRFVLLEAGPRILPELDPSVVDYAWKLFRGRGIDIRVNTRVRRIREGQVWLQDGLVLPAETILYAAGLTVNPIIGRCPLAKDRKGRIRTDATMRSVSHPEVWALGDCAAIPDPNGQPYPTLAQHALREARVLAENITRSLNRRALKPFVYSSRGTLALLGGHRGVGQIFGFHLRGLPAWFVWRTYYVFQMPKWERRLRVLLDWTVALFFPPDTAQLTFHVPPRPLRETTPADRHAERVEPLFH